jgi:hypothetical protein
MDPVGEHLAEAMFAASVDLDPDHLEQKRRYGVLDGVAGNSCVHGVISGCGKPPGLAAGRFSVW